MIPFDEVREGSSVSSGTGPRAGGRARPVDANRSEDRIMIVPPPESLTDRQKADARVFKRGEDVNVGTPRHCYSPF
ncbi:hypothetical protein AArcS_2683 [Natranaeroarchaeum sulfidigenes]|uniref:Uncharacterized protein n=1 Tax=Natranaeroarchaeum sulfidigenes TaxID=2784880 RepID=A0A897MY94_9EURY|nr:hypothetical protein AArcS_2683 [Natranaeroarchaeum sulfidigenes]